MIVKDDAPETSTEDFWYDLFEGGYFPPGDFLDEENDAQRVSEAMATVQQYRQALEDSGKVELT